MTDNLRRYCDIHSALKRMLVKEPLGNHARHVRTLALFINGIVGSRKCHLPSIATKSPLPSLRESRIKQLSRWLQNKSVTPETYFLPYVRVLLESLPEGPLVLVMDGSCVGRGCMALFVSVLYKKRAIPLCFTVVADWMVCLGDWVVRTGKLPLIHRKSRCDFSLFQIGLLWMEYCLNEEIPIRALFQVTLTTRR